MGRNSLFLIFVVLGACGSRRSAKAIAGKGRSEVVAPTSSQLSGEGSYRARVASVDDWSDIALPSASDADKRFCELVLKSEIGRLKRRFEVRDVRECARTPLPVQPGMLHYLLVQPRVVAGVDLLVEGLLDPNDPLVHAKAKVTAVERHATQAHCEESRRALEAELAAGAAHAAQLSRDWLTTEIQNLERERASTCEERERLAGDCRRMTYIDDVFRSCQTAPQSDSCRYAQKKRQSLAEKKAVLEARCMLEEMASRRCSDAEELLQKLRQSAVEPLKLMSPSCQAE
jgi:hypothetical protein